MLQYTPRQGSALLHHARARRRTELADLLWVVAMGSQGDGKEIDRKIKELADEPY